MSSDGPFGGATRARLLAMTCLLATETDYLMARSFDELPSLTTLIIRQNERQFTLPAMPSLSMLRLDFTRSDALDSLNALTTLRNLELYASVRDIEDSLTLDSRSLSCLTSLTILNVTSYVSQKVTLTPFPVLPALSILTLDHVHPPRLDLDQLPSLERLILIMKRAFFMTSDHDPRLFGRLRDLRLAGRYCRLAPEFWPSLTQLEALIINASYFTTEAARHLTSLTRLSLIGNSSPQFSPMQSLKHLVLTNNCTFVLDDLHVQTALTRLDVYGSTSLSFPLELSTVKAVRHTP